MKVDDVLLFRIASHSRQDISQRLLITSDAEQHRMFCAITPRTKRAKGTYWRTHNTAEIHSLVDQLRFFGRAHAGDRLFEFQISFCVGTHNPDVKWFLGRYCRSQYEQQHERKRSQM